MYRATLLTCSRYGLADLRLVLTPWGFCDKSSCFIPLYRGEPNSLNCRDRVVRKAENTVEMQFWTPKHDCARPDSFVPNISCVFFCPRTGVSVFSPGEALSLMSLSSPRGNRVPICLFACPPVVCASLFPFCPFSVCSLFACDRRCARPCLVCKRDSDPQALFDLTSSFL